MTPTPWRAICIMIVAMFLIPAGDAVAKLMIQNHAVDPGFAAWSRFGLGVLFCLPFLGRANLRLSALADWRVALRGVLIGATVGFILQAIRTEDLANVYGAFFVGPILSYLLSALLLGEGVRPAQTVLLLLGFTGVLLVVRPGFGMTPGMGFAVLAGLFYGAFLTSGRWLAGVAPPMTLLVVQLFVAALVLTPVGAIAIPNIWQGALPVLILLSAAFSMLANLLLLLAYAEVAATRLAPFVYTQIVAATLYGVVLFGDLPDLLSLAGLGLLLGSGFASLAQKPSA